MSMIYILHGSNGAAASSGLGQCLLVEVSSLNADGQVVLDLSVLGKVEGGNLLGLLDLLLVGIDLALELVNQSLHALLVLLVLVNGVGQLLDVTLRLAQVLGSISKTSVLSVKLGLKLTDASLHLGNGLLASLEGSLFSLIKTGLGILDLGLKKLLVSLKHHGDLLLSTELLSKSSSINHGSLGLVLGHLGLRGHLIQVVSEVVHLSLALGLGTVDGLVGAGLLRQSLIGVGKLLLNHPPVSVRLFQKGAGLLQSILVGVDSSLSTNEGVLSSTLGSHLFLVLGLNLSDGCLDSLDVSLTLSIGSVGMLKSNTKINNISLKLLLHSQSFNLALGLGLKLHLHAVNGLGKILLGGSELLILLSKTSFNLLPDLGQLKRSSENLVLPLLQSSLSFRQSSFKLHLFSLEPLADFVNLVDE